ncbi:tetratricopeptide repeat protein [Streptomyces scopuliridis]|uniref:tetratricopeptide repeat protein n=1 Tax=Streptomyces scopuliridis TaxID=452529 RepID=UPI0036CE197B
MWLSSEGRHADVQRLAEAEVADRTAEFGGDDPETLRSRRLLTSALRKVGDLDRAVAETRAVVEDSVRVLGSDHADTHRCRADLAQYLAENGEPAEGVRLLRALYTESRAFGPKRQEETRSIRHHLVLALEFKGEFQEALDLLDEEIADELGTIYGVDEFLGDHTMEGLREWRRRLVAKAASTQPGAGC